MKYSVALFALLVALVGCSGRSGQDSHVASLQSSSSGAGSTPSPSSDEDKEVAFARCMRQHGVDVPDPGANGGKLHISGSGGASKRGLDACRHLLPSGSKLNPTSPQQMDIMVQLARCLRRHGIDVPDPTVAHPDFQITAQQKRSHAFAEAVQACKVSKPATAPSGR